jgi:hypothetical protein
MVAIDVRKGSFAGIFEKVPKIDDVLSIPQAGLSKVQIRMPRLFNLEPLISNR